MRQRIGHQIVAGTFAAARGEDDVEDRRIQRRLSEPDRGTMQHAQSDQQDIGIHPEIPDGSRSEDQQTDHQ